MPPPDLGTWGLSSWAKGHSRSWQNTGAILGRGAAISQHRWQRSLHVNKSPRNSHQLGPALPQS